jgi:hypothetical protein
MITLQEAKELEIGAILYHVRNRNRDGSPQRWKVNGKVKTWETMPDRVKIPLKFGLWDAGYLTEKDLNLVTLDPEWDGIRNY